MSEGTEETVKAQCAVGARLRDSAKAALLPVGFPESVEPEYLEYQG